VIWDENVFRSLEAEQLERLALQHGFNRKRPRNWVRRTADFVQLVNLQRSQWSDERYLNFAMWALALGEPPTFVEYKFHFRTRGEHMAPDLDGFFSVADRLRTLDDVRAATASGPGRISCLMNGPLQALLSRPGRPLSDESAQSRGPAPHPRAENN
jgi:hypothetical protein